MSDVRKYAYYPGCSLESSAREFDVSTRSVMERLGCELYEVPDWTCCGASAAEAVSELLSLTLPGRNLALAGRDLPDMDFLVPCSACYLNHLKVAMKCGDDPALREKVDEALGSEALRLPETLRVRHLLDVLGNDIGAAEIHKNVERPLEGLKVAPYYGCQILRPYKVFDDPERPRSMNAVLTALGAEVVDWSHAGKCCGASLMATKKEAALPAVRAILAAASKADVIATVCPLCQMNLEAHQAAALNGSALKIVNVLYLTQLMGLAFGFSAKEMRINNNMAVEPTFVDSILAGAFAQQEAAP